MPSDTRSASAPLAPMFRDSMVRLHGDTCRRSFRRYLAALVLGLCFIAGAWINGDMNRAAEQHQHQLP